MVEATLEEQEAAAQAAALQQQQAEAQARREQAERLQIQQLQEDMDHAAEQDAAEVKRLIASRGAYKRIFRSMATALLAVPVTDGDSLRTVESKYSFINTRMKNIQGMDAEILLLTEDANKTTQEIKRISDFEDEMSQFVASYENKVAHYKLTSNTTPHTAAVSGVPSSSGPQQSFARYPRLEVPKFHGSYTDWTTFWDQFRVLIHDKTGLSNTEKLSFLKTSLHGEPEREIACYPVTDANYDLCVRRLKELYDNKRCIVKAHLDAMFQFTASRTESATALRKLAEHFNNHVRSLNVLGVPTNEWDAILTYMVASKMDPESRKQWELHSPGSHLQTFKQIADFLDIRRRALESAEASNSSVSTTKQDRFQPKPHARNTPLKSHHATTSNSCPVSGCSQQHRLNTCQMFRNLPQQKRYETVRANNMCFNCLTPGHGARSCLSTFSCKHCGKKHHSLIHDPNMTPSDPPARNPAQTASAATAKTSSAVEVVTVVEAVQGDGTSVTTTATTLNAGALLATAMIPVRNGDQAVTLRALLDSGSQASLIREDAATALHLKMHRNATTVCGVGVSSTIPKYLTFVDIGHGRTVQCFVVPQVTTTLPAKQVDVSGYPRLKHLKLADPAFNEPGRIDILLGADVHEELLLDVKIKDGSLYAKQTLYGFVVTGPLTDLSREVSTHVCSLENVQRFWQLEEVPAAPLHTNEEKQCEQHYQDTTVIDESGRAVVRLPFNTPPSELGSNEATARRQFYSLERRLSRNPLLNEQYCTFVDEFLSMGHMEVAPSTSGNVYYLPHHCVEKDSTTTKLRVVFNASSPTTTGRSLNDLLMIGPRTQDDLFDIVVRFRFHRYVLSADVAKMYRQIAIAESDRDYHRLFWRSNPQEPLKVLRMTRVIYGVASSSYHAIRALQETAKRHGSEAIQCIVNRDMYMDDLLSGAPTLKEAVQLQDEIIPVLAKGQFPLRKFTSNVPELVTRLPAELQEAGEAFELKDRDHSVKALGVRWKPIDDVFYFVSNFDIKSDTALTKRVLLSEVSKLFDPLGWITGAIIAMKILIQQTWALELDWDDPVPDDISAAFHDWMLQLRNIDSLTIPRFVLTREEYKSIELHMFCDASERAFAACIYVVASNQSEVKSQLLVAKSKVAPLKSKSVPRLELCAMHLGAKLTQAVYKALDKLPYVKISSTNAWSDSTIALAWIAGEPHRWCTFVANRVADIQQRLTKVTWRHVPTDDNPADVGSRGTTAAGLLPSTDRGRLWWSGPSWLTTRNYPEQPEQATTELESKVIRVVHTVTKKQPENELIDVSRYSSIPRMLRVLALCRRWRTGKRGPITAKEKYDSLMCLAASEQKIYFKDEISQMESEGQVKRQSAICSLYPFLDKIDYSVVRVGGRLARSNLDVLVKYPILIPRQSLLAQLITLQAHLDTLHGTASVTMAHIRNRFWVTRGIEVVKLVKRKCVTCARFRVAPVEQLMGDLPSARTDIPPRAFTNVGLDFAGPFFTKDRKGEIKCYLCLFVCLASKAIHLELTTELSSLSCLAAIKRFVSRRGLPTVLLSDNGSNFIGVRNDLMKAPERTKVGDMGITWKLIPPASPHFGGIWEAGVKSAKHHLKRTLGTSKLTYEELTTLLCQIEQILNSRPLCALADDPSDQLAITPAHLIMGATTEFFPEARHYDEDPPEDINRCKSIKKRWIFINQQLANFWKRWSTEYVTGLQMRKKWRREEENLKVGDIVLISDDNVQPLRWPLGRIVHAYAGHENYVRVCKVKTSHGTFTRPITKIRRLPIQNEDTV